MATEKGFSTLNVEISDDDFGPAKREPVPAQSSAGREWKIDRTCVKDMGVGNEDSVFVSAIPMLARALGSGGMEKAWKRPSNTPFSTSKLAKRCEVHCWIATDAGASSATSGSGALAGPSVFVQSEPEPEPEQVAAPS
tara:strand:- start:3753 stop:4166 length:414 start_codon:yes stop_codon:yes gene_type:complete